MHPRRLGVRYADVLFELLSVKVFIVSLGRALIGLVVVVLLAGFLPVGLALERRLEDALQRKAMDDLALAPRILADRFAASADMRMMHAKDVAQAPGVAAALMEGDVEAATRAVEAAPRGALEQPILIDASGESHLGPVPAPDLVEATRGGEMPVVVVPDQQSVQLIAIAPVKMDGTWVGAAGVVFPLDDTEAATLAGLTRSDVAVLGAGGRPVAMSLSADTLALLLTAVSGRNLEEGAVEVAAAGRNWIVTASSLPDGVARILFARDLDRELAVVPELRRVALYSIGLALVFALLLGGIFASRLARPVRSLASAADRFAAGDLEAPLARSGIREVSQVADAFDVMRQRLASRVSELEAANTALADRQERLSELQSELSQRDRLSAAGRLLTQLAHEIRNPVASVRNCLELLRRRVKDDPEAEEVADLAIDELLRMHELAEQMMDLNRPRDAGARDCDPVEVANQVAALARAGAGPEDEVELVVSQDPVARVAIAPDSLKQVLINLVQNGREAMAGKGRLDIVVSEEQESVRIAVLDTGPGIQPSALGRIFDPFFTTKDSLHGVGLGLFTAEGLVRGAGGRLSARNREDTTGALFEVELLQMSAAEVANV